MLYHVGLFAVYVVAAVGFVQFVNDTIQRR